MLQARLDGLVGKPSGLIETLPKPIQRRIKYLQNLQGEYDDREEEYEKELDELDKKYEKIYGAPSPEARLLLIVSPEVINRDCWRTMEFGVAFIGFFNPNSLKNLMSLPCVRLTSPRKKPIASLKRETLIQCHQSCTSEGLLV